MYGIYRSMSCTGLFFAALLWPIEISSMAAVSGGFPLPGLSGEETRAWIQAEKQGNKPDPYDRAVQAMDDRSWDQAIELFTETIRQKDSRTDGAMYWQAYCQNKMGRRLEALSILKTLFSNFPDSKWTRDAKALEAEMRRSTGQNPLPEGEADEDLKLMAVNSLLVSDPERAVPMLEKVLRSNQPTKIKERALFVLAQSGSERAKQLLVRIAQGDESPELQTKAIQNLGLFGTTENRELLSRIYTSTADAKIKRTILRSYMTSGDRTRLVALAETEKDMELRREAIRQLGVMNLREDLRRLYQAEIALEAREEILRALFIAGDTETMAQVARTEKDVRLRRTAIRHLGLSRADKNSELLISLYQNEKEPEIRQSAIEGLFLQGNAKALIELARKEANPEMKKKILGRLSLMRSPEATAYFTEILEK